MDTSEEQAVIHAFPNDETEIRFQLYNIGGEIYCLCTVLNLRVGSRKEKMFNLSEIMRGKQ